MSEYESKGSSSPSGLDDFRSQFTRRDLRNLSRSLTTCPLRVIALLDFDAFYAQCETVRLGLPAEQPLAVQQWNAIIALNYSAKAAGLKRIVTPDEARRKCPEIVIQHVATWREGNTSWAYRSDALQHMGTDKAALDPYRVQSRKAFELIKDSLPSSPIQKVEKAGIDEVFLDLSCQVYHALLDRFPELPPENVIKGDLHEKLPLPTTAVLDWATDKVVAADFAECEFEPLDWDDVALSIGSQIVRQIRHEIYQQLHYTCSAGLARNKAVAKLAAGHNKPNGQTVVRSSAISAFFAGYKFAKIRGLGGKLGRKVVERFGTENVGDLLKVSSQKMQSELGSDFGLYVYNLVRGVEYSEVVERTQLQSMLSAKTFIPKAQTLDQAEKWLRILAGDLMGRLDEEAFSRHRRPKVIAVHHHIDGRFGPTRSKQTTIPSGATITAQLLYNMSRDLLVQISREGPTWPCLGVHVSVSHFEDVVTGNRELTSFFSAEPQAEPNENAVSPDPYLADNPQISKLKRKRSLLNYCEPQKELVPRQRNLPRITPKARHAAKTSRVELIEAKGEDADSYCCPKCGALVSSIEVLEHLDWHVALELQNE